jgi:hypothetical protein
VKISRSEFLTTAGAALLGAVLNEPLAGRGLPGTRYPLHRGLADLPQHVGTMFRAGAPGIDAQRLLLTRVDHRTVDDRLEQVSAVFRGAAGRILADGTYEFQHPALGRLDLFIVAVGTPGADHAFYEACFSRFRKVGPPHGQR